MKAALSLVGRIHKNSLLFYSVIFLTLFFIIWIGQLLYFAVAIPMRSYIEGKRQNTAKSASQDKYQQLLIAQRDSPNPTISLSNTQREARGDIHLNIVLVKPPTLREETIRPLVENLRKQQTDTFQSCDTQGCRENISLFYIPDYLKQEAAKFDIKDTHVTISTHGTYPLKDLTQVGDFANVWNKDPFGVAKVQDAFENVLDENNVNDNELTIFLYFDNSNEAPKVDQGSFYDYKKFRSFANDGKGRAYVNVYDFSPSFSQFVVLVVAHEFLHLFGASDKYIESSSTGRMCSSKGLGEPDKVPLYPQTTGDIMCLFVETSNGKFTRGSLVGKTLVIGPATAREIGWIKD